MRGAAGSQPCARMPVEIILDYWNPSVQRYRAGATRKVPGRSGMTHEERDWIDEELTAHRDPDE